MYSFWALCVLACFSVVYSLDLPECKRLECAEYKVIEKKANYEVRQYGSYKVASVTSNGVPWYIASIYNFQKLFKYIRGDNEKSIRMKMTAPVISFFNINEKTGEMVKDELETGFFMSKSLNDIPKPKDEKIKIIDFGPVTVYAVSHGGYATPSVIRHYQKKLHDDLKADGVEFDESYFVSNQYNAPFQVWNRHNDILYLAA